MAKTGLRLHCETARTSPRPPASLACSADSLSPKPPCCTRTTALPPYSSHSPMVIRRCTSNRYNRRLDSSVSHSKQTAGRPSNRHRSHPGPPSISPRIPHGCGVEGREAFAFHQSPIAVHRSHSSMRLLDTANRVEIRVSHRKQKPACLSTRDGSHPAPSRRLFAGRLARHNPTLANRTRLVVFVSAVVGGDKIPVQGLTLPLFYFLRVCAGSFHFPTPRSSRRSPSVHEV